MRYKTIAQFIFFFNIALFLACNSVLANGLNKDSEFLLGPVKTIHYFSNINNISTSTTKHFREDGSIERLEFNMFSKSVIIWDQKGRSIRYEAFTSDGKKTVTSTSFDDEQHKYVTYYQKPGYPNEVSGSLDKNGKVIDHYEYDLKGGYKGKTISEYSDAGLVTETNYFDDTNKHFLNVIYKYNDSGLCVLNIAYRDNGSISRKTEYEYDENGRCIESRSYESDYNSFECNLKFRTQVIFDKNGRQIETHNYNKGSFGETTTIISYTDFDKHGNWLRSIKKYENTNGNEKKDQPFMTRSIEYY
ncbi:MAG: hypothetical protein H6Q72_1393 [Firmicutes bacterium]|nr:hypothetical protein [Bacillota bacterium]